MPTHPPICPNCDYDQSGEVATWSTQCPTKGQCSECGHKFEWSEIYEILSQWDSSIDWYAEHARTYRQLLRRTPGTFARLLIPFVFFRDINHRRRIKLWTLARWMLLTTIAVHLLVSIIGLPNFNDETFGSITPALEQGLWYGPIHEYAIDAIAALVFPYSYFTYYDGYHIFSARAYEMYEWTFMSVTALVGVGVTLSWIVLMCCAFLVQGRWDTPRKLLGRTALLSLIPPLIHLQAVRLIFGYDLVTGKTSENQWLVWVYVFSVVVMILWQQLIWTNAVIKVWRIKPSWPINLGGCFGTTIGGFLFVLMFF